MKTIYLIRHSAPFVEIENYEDYKNVLWSDYNRNMILSSEGEENAKKLCNVEELKHLDAIYSADSFRAIGTAKYVAEINNLKIKLDSRINERNLGVNTISELPDNQTLESFSNKDYKFGTGESLNEVDKMMSFLQNNTIFSFDGKNMRLLFNNKELYNGKMKNPMIFKIEYEKHTIVNIEEINSN